MKITTLLFLLMTTSALFAQWTGTYIGSANGDQVRLTLAQNGETVTGEMKDSYQFFEIAGTAKGLRFTGTATERTLQLQFDFFAVQSGDLLECKLSIEISGTTNESDFTLQKEDESQVVETDQSNAVSTKIPFPKDATFPAALVATWTQNESYNSGSGDNFMGANFSQSTTFYNDGTISEGGSSASVSGSNYSGQSTGSGSGKVEGAGWYAKQKELYIIVNNNGKWESYLLGTWYTENNHLLLTTVKGEKILLNK